jgi:hypothetical protein
MPEDKLTEMLAAIGLDLRDAPPAGTPEFNEWMKTHALDPKVRARAAAVFTTHPEMREFVKQAQEIMEGRALRLLQRPDFEPLLLSMREVAPALDLMHQRTNKLHWLLSLEKPLRQEMEAQMQDVWMGVIHDYLPLLLPPSRRAWLIKDLRSYAQQQKDQEAAESAYTALLILESTPEYSENGFVVGYIMESIRSAMEELSHWKIVEE